MGKHAHAVRDIHVAHLGAASPLRARIRTIEEGMGRLNATARADAMAELAELRRKLSAAQAERIEAAENEVVQARAALAVGWPEAREGLAAAKRPAEAVAMRSLADGASESVLRTYVHEVVRRSDLAAVHGLREAILRRTDIDAKDDLLAELDSVTLPETEALLADVIGAQNALASLRLDEHADGLLGAVMADPTKALAEHMESATVLGRNGEPRSVGTAEFERLVEASGIPLAPPEAPALRELMPGHFAAQVA